MILLIDNYDSFSYNLFQMIGAINTDIKIIRNDSLTCKEIQKMNPSKIIISPGPGRPEDAGIIQEAILYFKSKIPILGICLGHQAICQAFGGKIIYSPQIVHAKQSQVSIDKTCKIFKGLPSHIGAGRYHSLSADTQNFPKDLKIISQTLDKQIMGVKHKKHEIYGLQFHPESILTPLGQQIISNFLLD